MDPLPPGLFQAGQQGGVKPVQPIKGLKPGVKASSVDTFDGLFLPAAVVTAAAGAGVESKSFGLAIKAVTGIKLPPLGGPGIPTPFALGLLAPQPAGLLPEQFFMKKPHIPGTGIFLDPVYMFNRQIDKRDQRRQAAARVSQNIAFQNLLEDLTDDELRRIVFNSDLKSQYLAFLDPREVDRQLIAELQQREAVRRRNAPLSPDVIADIETNHQILQSQYAARDAIERERLRRRAVQVFVLTLRLGLVGSASIKPEDIEPVNDAARRNQAAARGIRRQLVSERADP